MIRNGICERVKASRGGVSLVEKASSYIEVKSSSELGSMMVVDEVMNRIEGLVEEDFTAEVEFEDDDAEFEFMASLVDAEFAEGPVDAKPGSALKVAVIARRYAEGLPLWHDDDMKIAITSTHKNRGGNPTC